MKLPPQAWYVLGALVVLGAGVYAARRGLKAAGHAINPTNPDNVFYSGTSAIGTSITGDESWSLGGAFYDWTHPNNPFTH